MVFVLMDALLELIMIKVIRLAIIVKPNVPVVKMPLNAVSAIQILSII